MSLQVVKNLQVAWRDKELRRYHLLKEVVTLMGLFEYLGLGGAMYSLGARDFRQSLIFGIVLGVSYYVSTKLQYRVNEMMIEMGARRAYEQATTDSETSEPVPGKGNADVKIPIIGRNLGRREDIEGMPFISPTKSELDKMLVMANLDPKAQG